MAEIVFKNPRFVKTATSSNDYPLFERGRGKSLPEIAIGGRSNVGKSSLLNHLFQSKRLVRTSSTPGKTQALNFFILNDQLSFVDLPGYGYAKVPLHTRREWGTMVQTYLETRKSLKLFLFLFDSRRVPTHEDKQLLEWAAHHQMAIILVLTKIDKVKSREKMFYTRRILEAFNADSIHYLHYSATKSVGRQQLIAMINDALKEEL